MAGDTDGGGGGFLHVPDFSLLVETIFFFFFLVCICVCSPIIFPFLASIYSIKLGTLFSPSLRYFHTVSVYFVLQKQILIQYLAGHSYIFFNHSLPVTSFAKRGTSIPAAYMLKHSFAVTAEFFDLNVNRVTQPQC